MDDSFLRKVQRKLLGPIQRQIAENEATMTNLVNGIKNSNVDSIIVLNNKLEQLSKKI